MIEHLAQRYHNRTLRMDGQVFRACTFLNCDLRYDGGARFDLEGNRYEGYLNLELAGTPGERRQAAETIERDVRRFGYVIEVAHMNEEARLDVWRFHTLLPREA